MSLKKACAYCVYQERTQEEVRKKLKEWKIIGDQAEEIITWLITENFINEARYAEQFAGGKFRIKKWGRRKIMYELTAKGLSKNCIQQAIASLDKEEYYRTLTELALKKYSDLKAQNLTLAQTQKVRLYLIKKGYEPDLVTEVCEEIFP